MKRTHLLPSQDVVLQDVSQIIEGCPNLYNISSNKTNVSVLSKLISKTRDLFEDNEDGENNNHIVLLGETIKKVYESSKDIKDENFFIYVVNYIIPQTREQAYSIEILTNDDFEEWKEDDLETFEDCINYHIYGTLDDFEQRLIACKIIK